MYSREPFPSMDALFDEAAEGLNDRLDTLTVGAGLDNMIRMALSPTLNELQILQRAFTASPQYKSTEAERFVDPSSHGNQKIYATDTFLNEFHFSPLLGKNQLDAEDAQRLASNIPLRKWTEPVRFAETGDSEIDTHLSALLDQLIDRQAHAKNNSLPVDQGSLPSPGSDGNCFIYLVPEKVDHLFEGFYERIRVKFAWGTDPRDKSAKKDRYRRAKASAERRRRQRLGEVGTFCKFPAQYPSLVSWLEDGRLSFSSDDEIIPFAPFHLFNLDGFLIADRSHNIKAAVALIDSLSHGNAKLELVTEFFVRSFGLPAINRATTRSATSRRQKPLGQFLDSEDPGRFGMAVSLSATETRAIGQLYDARLSPGMTDSSIKASMRAK